MALAGAGARGDDRRGARGRWTARRPTSCCSPPGSGSGWSIAPVNTVLLGVTGADVHGSASALAVVARTVGMLAGLSLLTAVALRRFTAAVAAIGSPVELCPDSPAHCPAYDDATNAAVLTPAAHGLRRRRDRRRAGGGRRRRPAARVRTPSAVLISWRRSRVDAPVVHDLRGQPLALADQPERDVAVGDARRS